MRAIKSPVSTQRCASILLLLMAPTTACSPDAGSDAARDAAPPPWAAREETGGDAGRSGTFTLSDGGEIPADRFASEVTSFSPGECAGFGLPAMPEVVLGPPVGAGGTQGSTDVVSLGRLGTIVLSFERNPIVDGAGADFVVFENAFYVGGNASSVYGEPAEVSVSDDGVIWKTFRCTTVAAPYDPTCAGIHPVFAGRTSGISPVDYPTCGGDAFNLADVGLARARFVRIHDIGSQTCDPDPKLRTTTNGFDLEACSSLKPGH